MTRDEYLAVLESEPATPNQRGAIVRACDRLGLTDRAERLAMCAALLGLDALGSTGELTMGQADQLVNVLQRTRDRAELPDTTAATTDDDRGEDELTGHADEPGADDDGLADDDPDAESGDDEGAERVTIIQAIGQVIAFAYLVLSGKDYAQKDSGQYCPEYTVSPRERAFLGSGARTGKG